MKKIFTLLFLFSLQLVTAQWTNDTAINTLVVDSEVDDMQSLGTSSGETYVIFWKAVPAPVNYELRMQVLDIDGNKTLGEGGVLVSDQIPMGTYTVVWKIFVDNEDNIYIGTTGTGAEGPAFVFKLDSNGNQLWGSNGVNIGNGNVVTILPLSSGGAIVSWMGASGGLMQKLDQSGVPQWPVAKPIVGSGATVPANLFELSNGDYIMVFHILSFGINSTLNAQRFSTEGNAVWSAPVQLSDRTTAFNRSYRGLQDGDVVYMGYFASSGNRFDSYLQRIDPDGTLPWGINGADFDIAESDYEMDTEIAFKTGSQFIWSVVTYTDINQSMKGEYVQKFDKISGEGLLGANAKQIYPLGSEKVHAGRLLLKDGTPLFLIKDGLDNGATPVTLHVVYLDENGDFGWSEETKPMATYSANKGRIQFNEGGVDQYIAVFTEDKGEGNRIYAQNYLEETVGVEEFSGFSLSYLNPIPDEMIISANVEIKSISVVNVLGQQIFISEFNKGNSIVLNTQKWKRGIYFMDVITNQGVKSGIKLIKS